MFIEPKAWLDALQEQRFAHVYLYRADAYFNKTFAGLFEIPSSMENETLFELQSDSSPLCQCE